MNLRAIQQAIAPLVNEFVPCHDQTPANYEFPFAYVGMPTLIEIGSSSLAGGHIVDMPITLCFSRTDDQVAQTQLSEILSSGLLDIFDTEIEDAPWYVAQFTVVDKFRVAKLAGDTIECIACDLNFQVRTKPT
jgi:hypothetical protein